MKKIRKILVANRGEIAVRIMKTAERLGISTVAVYAANDKKSYHVSRADEAYALGNGTLSDTYLNLEKLEAVMRLAGVDAVHPGYGFLSENPALAELCEKHNVLFVGPDANAIRMMGDKITSRELALKAGVNISEGITGKTSDILERREELDYPVLVKATAGGGGKGMRIVESPERLQEVLLTTSREALNYFGNETVYVEHYFRNPRHIEVQVLGDKHGNLVHLFERECSLQRRHQKVIEEAPSAYVDDSLRKTLTDSALKLAREIGYHSAGTVEFLVDKDNNVFFLEMNTRIQVEHPVTEKITGIDIVEEQIRVAEGRELSFRQQEVKINGHAMQARLYAEDPLQDYRPAPGFLQTITFPDTIDIRIDHGLNNSDYIFADYDPMIAKVIAHAQDRGSAIDKLKNALQEVTIIGRPTNQEFLCEILNNHDFLTNSISTQYLEVNTGMLVDSLNSRKNKVSHATLIAAFVVTEMEFCQHAQTSQDTWKQIGFWRLRDHMRVKLADKNYDVRVRKLQNKYSLQIEDAFITASCISKDGDDCIIEINNVEQKYKIVKQNVSDAVLKHKGYYYALQRLDILRANDIEGAYQDISQSQKDVISPVHGRIVSVDVKEGELVKAGDNLLVIESMKIENNILAEADVVVEEIKINEGDQVRDGQLLITMSEPEMQQK